jgi:acyl-coenzyme A thioesterase PaaI-like protein
MHKSMMFFIQLRSSYGAFTLDVKSMLIENLGGILGGTQCSMGDSLMLSEC